MGRKLFKIRLIVYMVVLVTTAIMAQSSSRNWRLSSGSKVKWSPTCDFIGGDYNKKRRVPSAAKCGDICLSQTRCTHFMKNLLGECLLKNFGSKKITEKGAPFYHECGFVIDRVFPVNNKLL